MKSLKTRRITIICLVLLTVSFATATLFLRAPDQSADPVFNTEKTDYKYLVKGHMGMVSVFMSGESDPIYITETHVDTLPVSDRQMLEDGIPVYYETELTAILEDYGS